MTVIDNPDAFMAFVYIMAGFFGLSVLALCAIAMWEDRR